MQFFEVESYIITKQNKRLFFDDIGEKHTLEFRGDVTLQGDIPSNIRIFAYDANVIIKGNVWENVEIYLKNSPPKEFGFLGRLFGKKADVPAAKFLRIEGKTDDFLKIDAPDLAKIEFLGDVGKALEIDANEACDIILKNTGSHLKVMKAALLKATNVGAWARLHGIDHLDVERFGCKASVSASSMSVQEAENDCSFVYCGDPAALKDLESSSMSVKPFSAGRLWENCHIHAPKIEIGRPGHTVIYHGTYEQPKRQAFVPRVIQGGRAP